MCGITGYFNLKNQFSRLDFSRANNIIRHRGPDDFGYVTFNNDWSFSLWKDESLSDFQGENVLGAIGFRRLSIIDLSYNGHQPMNDHSKNLWIVFNGEIYNYIELRSELKKLGYVFKSDTDTEVILYAYKEWGNDCLKRFNGMWAFCILDLENKKLFCARDRLGIKPFYYFADKHSFIFGSEMKQIMEMVPGIQQNANDRLIFDFLALGSYANETNETYFNDIYKLDPGSWMEVDLINLNEIRFNKVRWWQLPEIEISWKEEQIYEKIYEILLDSVRLRLRSDVPQGTALSGGLDSSVIVSLVNILRNGDKEANKVFTIVSDDLDNDDKYYADMVIKSIPVTPFQKTFEEIARLDELPKLLWHQEEPIQTASIFGSWELYKYFREQNITVNLDGQGADELLYGYNNFPFRNFLVSSLLDFGLSHTREQISEIAKVYQTSGLKVYGQLSYGLAIRLLRDNTGLYQRIKLNKVRNWMDTGFYSVNIKKSYVLGEKYIDNNLHFDSELKKHSYTLLKHTNLPGILRQVDRNSMAFSVESRVPFLDYRFVELAYTIPPSLMIKNGYTKYPLRMAIKGKLMNEVLWRKTKVGFRMPEYEILAKNKDYVREVVASLRGDSRLKGISFGKEVELYLESKKTYDNILWRFFIYALWKKQFKID